MTDSATTTLAGEIARHFPGHFTVLILDNEVTVGDFVTDPPLPWARLVAAGGAYRVGEGYPARLTAAEAEREKLNWDKVSDPVICAALGGLDDSVGLVAFGNNAGQGLKLAGALPPALRAGRGAVIYGRTLPERPVYAAAGFRRFCARAELVTLAGEMAATLGRPLAFAFINTIEHNEQNYHTPWRG